LADRRYGLEIHGEVRFAPYRFEIVLAGVYDFKIPPHWIETPGPHGIMTDDFNKYGNILRVKD
jgi:hypothetical protein